MMNKRWFTAVIICGLALSYSNKATSQTTSDSIPPTETPTISYAHPMSKVIAGIEVQGNQKYDAPVIISISGLRIGERVTLPGDEITAAIKNFLRNGLFSDVSISASKVEDDKVWLVIHIEERPHLSKILFTGIKKSEGETLLKNQLSGLQQGSELTPNIVDRVVGIVQKHFDGKGYSNVKVSARQVADKEQEGFVTLILDVDKNAKIKVHEITFEGNENITDFQLRKAMKKTNEGFSLSRHALNSILEIFSQKKFVKKDYKQDINNILSLYHQHGYRDAEIISDTIQKYSDKKVNIVIKIDEGPKYYINDINIVGNTKYSTADLKRLLGMKKGDIYDQKKLDSRLTTDEDALSNLYSNNGHLFIYMEAVETEIKNDSVSLDIRINEGKPATINKVGIRGNDRLYEDVVRRELYTKPGMLFSRDYVIRSIRQIAQMGQFDPEKIVPNINPHQESGTVDIEYDLTSKNNDQIEFSAGWSQTGLLGRVALKFTNFSMRNLFNPKSYKGFLPQGDGQTLTFSAQSNGKYYQSYSVQFSDPWFGGKRPNLFSVSAWMSRQTDINRKFYNSQINKLPYNPYYGGYGGYYSGYGSYGGYPGGYGRQGYDNGYGYGAANIYESAYDPDKILDMYGISLTYGKRLVWPDDNFQLQGGVNYTLYRMKNWSSPYFYFGMDNGYSNDINMSLNLSRISIDNPIYTRRGSNFSVNLSATPPYSLFDGKDYSNPKLPNAERNKFIEYYKIKVKGENYLPLMDERRYKRTPVLMTRAESGFIGSYSQYKQSPFGTFYVGGDGMSGYSMSYLNETIGLRGYRNGSISGATGRGAYAYARMSMELRYPLVFENSTTIWVLGFMEAGNAWERIRDYNPFQLKRSAGVGVRIMLPMIGLMGLDWGYGFDKPDGSPSIGGSNLHFVIGQQF